MAQQINARIKLNAERLNFPLSMLYPRTGHSFRLLVEKVPSDCTSPFVRVFRPNGSYFDIPGNIGSSGVTFYIIGTCFPDAGSAKYEIHATDSEGNPTALGEGLLEIKLFSTTTTPVTPGTPVQVAQIPAQGGGVVQIQMVQDSVGEWTYQALTVPQEVEA